MTFLPLNIYAYNNTLNMGVEYQRPRFGSFWSPILWSPILPEETCACSLPNNRRYKGVLKWKWYKKAEEGEEKSGQKAAVKWCGAAPSTTGKNSAQSLQLDKMVFTVYRSLIVISHIWQLSHPYHTYYKVITLLCCCWILLLRAETKTN